MEGSYEDMAEGPDLDPGNGGTGEGVIRTFEQEERIRHLVAALRTGGHMQALSNLNRHTAPSGNSLSVGLCCLGVACEAAIADGLHLPRTTLDFVYSYGTEDDRSDTVLPQSVVSWYGLPDNNPYLKVPAETAAEVDDEGFQWNREEDPDWLVCAADLNDDYGFTFAQIADAFEYTFLPQDWEVTRASRG